MTACLFFASEAGAEGLRKGPWLMDMRPGSVVVMAERSSPGPLHVHAVALGPAEANAPVDAALVTDAATPPPLDADSSEAVTLHEVRLAGLAAGTRYQYEVRGPGVDPVTGVFSTPPLTPSPFRFAIYGDTRSDPQAHAAIVQAVLRDGPDFAIHTGDLVEDGRDESLWQDFFTIEAPLLRNVPFVPVIGNHEIVGMMSSGVENYRRYVHVTGSGPSEELDYTFRFANTRFVLVNAWDDWRGESRDWLRRELERARREGPDDWLFVVMHWGPRSSGPHGNNDPLHRADVDDLIKRAGVDLVISGHDHAYERGDDHGLRYMVSGGGGAPLYPPDHRHRHSKVYAAEYHHVRCDVEGERITFTAFRYDGTVLDRAVLRHEGWEDMPRERESKPPDRPRHVDEPEPETTWSWKEMKPLAKYVPLFVAVGALALWLRRRAQ